MTLQSPEGERESSSANNIIDDKALDPVERRDFFSHRLSSINHKTIINFFACSTTCNMELKIIDTLVQCEERECCIVLEGQIL